MTNERIYVAVDLETTGLNPKQDAIIEIGALRFTCAPFDYPQIRVLDRFVTFINPGRTIPLRIQQLTGITDTDVMNAPTIEQIAPEFISFVGDDTRYLVAHNAGFDGSFLRASGIDLHRPMQDTFELATILCPGQASYSLVELARSFHISLPDAHRALDDAEATANLFGILLNRIPLLPQGIGRILQDCGREAQWAPLFLFSDLESANQPSLSESSRYPVDEDVINDSLRSYDYQCEDTDWDDIRSCYQPGGCINLALGSMYEYRSGQTDMSERVFDALSQGDHLLIEAGTGTGKTLAYLLPAALWAMHNNERVTIATNTIALQDQILDKDMPLVRSLLEHTKQASPTTALLKGRSNYLCTRRLYLWYRNRALNLAELRLLAKILVWIQLTESGDVSELFIPTTAERSIWQHVTSDAGSCSYDRCSASCRADRDILGVHYCDFFHLAHNRAEHAQIVVVNHALLLSDIESGGRVLPPYENVVIDEAHRLEEAATDQLTFSANWKTLSRLLVDLESSGELCQQLLDGCRRSGDIECQNWVVNIAASARTAKTEVRSFSDRLAHYLRNHEEMNTGSIYTQRVAMDHSFRSQPAWSELETEWDHVSYTFTDLVQNLETLTSDLSHKQWWLSEPYSSYLSELHGTASAIGDMSESINQIIYGTGSIRNGNRVAWAEIDDRKKQATLVSAPMFISDVVERELIHNKRSVILTGATLRTGSGFAFIRDRLGLWDVTASTVESPFDYKESTLLFMPSDMPDPRSSGYQQAVERAIKAAALAAEGSTMALFTSYAQLRTTADAIRGPLDRQGITVLQHGTSSRRRLLREYRSTEKAVLLGTRSFWEGIDLPGDELRCLLIVRLPFAVPSDPLVAARTAEMENAFHDYTLPDAILRFRQGFGRLIRRTTDRGAVVLLDSRVWRKEYGRSFEESLPTCTTKHAPLDTLQHEIRAWLNDSGKVD